MTNPSRFASFAVACVLSAAALPAWSQQAPAESPQQSTEVLSLAGLPAPVRAQLLGKRPEQISDRDGPFNPGDVAMPGVPSRRFVRALVGGGVAVVDVEQGGRGYYVERMEFREVGDSWKLVRRETVMDPPSP